MKRVGIPLAFYYAMTIGLPLANGAGGDEFVRHGAVVAAVPLVLSGSFWVVRALARVVLKAKGA